MTYIIRLFIMKYWHQLLLQCRKVFLLALGEEFCSARLPHLSESQEQVIEFV